MRALLTDIVHLFLSLPFYYLLGLLLLGLMAYKSARGTTLHRYRHVFPVLGLLVYLLSIPATSSLLEWRLEGYYPVPQVSEHAPRTENTIIVLTAGWLRSTPQGFEQKIGEAGWERTAAAVELWKKIGGRLLFSGAPAPDGGSAAEKMALLARAFGVPEHALLVETESVNTRENLLFSKKLMGDRKGVLWLVTSALHMPRSVAVARALGLEVIPYPCDFRVDQRVSWRMFVPANSAPAALEAALHELLGTLQYHLRGWVR